jgi:hypothetical protein
MTKKNRPITQKRFLKGYPFFIAGEPNRIYNYLPEPETLGFIAENKHFKADVIQTGDDGFSFEVDILGESMVRTVRFSNCIDYEFSEFADKQKAINELEA